MSATRPPTQALVPAAGIGARLAQQMPKALVAIGGRPILAHTLDAIARAGFGERIVVAIDPKLEAAFAEAVRYVEEPVSVVWVQGGAERQDSVANGLDALDPATEIVAIHDAARPFVAPPIFQAAVDAAVEMGAATVAVPVSDTILIADDAEHLAETPDRSRLWACQTPQVFWRSLIADAHRAAQTAKWRGTDDATLVRRTGHPVRLIRGAPENFKITLPTDLEMAEWALARGR